MNRLTNYLLDHNVLFWSLVAFIVAGGIFYYTKMPKLEDPATTNRIAVVAVPYPGATADVVEERIAKSVESSIQALPDILEVKTTCSSGIATFNVEFSKSLDKQEIEHHYDLLRRRMYDLEMSLPSGAYNPIIVDDMSDVYGLMYALTGDGYSYEEMDAYAKDLKNEILKIKGVKRVNIVGKRPTRINLDITRSRLAGNGMLPTQLMLSLRNVGAPIADGKMYISGERMAIETGETTEIEEISNLPVSMLKGTARLGDVVDGLSADWCEPQTGGYFVDGQPALAICVALESDAVVPEVGKTVDNCRLNACSKMPVGIEVQKIFFQPDMVDKAISGFLLNLLESVLIVILVLTVFMGLRSSLVIGAGLVLTILGSFIFLGVWGTTLQRISLGAFIVVMGMLVDNSVVIMDGILVGRQNGLSRQKCLTGTVQKLSWPLLGATLIAVVSFIGVYLSKGSVSEYASDLFKVICVSLLISWVLSITQIPFFADKFIPDGDKKEGKTATAKVQGVMRSVLNKILSNKWLYTSLAVVLLIAGVLGFSHSKVNLFCDFEYSQFIVECFWPSETDGNTVKEKMLEMTELLHQNENVKRVCASQGSAPARYCMFRPMTSGGEPYGELMIDFDDYKTLQKEKAGIRKLLREKYPEAYIRIRGYNFSVASSHVVEVEFSGDDPEILRYLAGQAKDVMRKSDNIDSYSIQDNWGGKVRYIDPRYNLEAGKSAGISRSDVAGALEACTTGKPIGVMQNGDERQIIYLNVTEEDGTRIKDLRDIPVWSTINVRAGENILGTIPLSTVSDGLEVKFAENCIRRVNGKRAIEVECDVNPDNDASPNDALSDIRDEIESICLPEGYSMRWLGEKSRASDGIGGVLKYSIIGVVVIFIILLILFNSWKCIMIMLFCIPFIICGIVPTLQIFNMPFTFMTLIGLLGLVGMMVKNTVVLQDEINRLRQEMEPYNAIVEATISRVRPVLMSSITTVVGVIPLLPDPMYGSMAAAIMGGLLVGTITTLILYPLFYSLIFKIEKQK